MLQGIGNNVSRWWNRHVGGGQDDFSSLQSSHSSFLDGLEECGARRVAIGAGAGAAIGGALGYAKGLANLRADRVEVQTQTYAVTRPVLVGAHYVPESCTTQFTYDGDGNMTGSYPICDSHESRPVLRQDPTGQTYQNQSLTHSSSWRNPMVNAGVGMLAGAAVGAAGALLYSLVQPDEDDTASFGSRSAAPWVGLGVGAAVGAGAGWYAGHLADARQVVLDHVVSQPVTRNEQIGFIPRPGDFPRANGNDISIEPGSTRFDGGKPVVVPVPTGEIAQKSATTRAYGLNALNGTLIGLGLGAGAGFAAGVAGGLVLRGLERE